MAQLSGNKKIKTAVFISGTGSNLKNLIQFSKKKKSPISINLIISNNFKSKGLRFAKIYKIKKKIFKFKEKALDEKKLLKILKDKGASLICLAGFMEILSGNFIKSFKGKILNIHPSLLPKYKGLDTHKRVLINKEKYTGCTVHFVSSKLDAGKIIVQKRIKIKRDDTPKKIAKRVLVEEHKLYPKAILKIFNL
ncbi:MAG: phosphoribosylglycinamide formyltransferase [Pelagibacterales bacterium MED-G44]|nr:MAG: phosphoribosylglycinamide formyltransferase [Pelagibacterales bacterium MED-G44]